ncbi:MAG: hypothetical protein EG825_17995 [Rhodocyclaceae bacterium]|nr:hypothetical protein [Rhodocyclaceae bacterium]
MPAWPLAAGARHNVFLAFKEALNNALRHASANEVRISLTLLPQGFQIELADDGRGFKMNGHHGTLKAGSPAAGNGLSNMRQRIEGIGGQFSIESQPSQGTTVRFTLPAPHAH